MELLRRTINVVLAFAFVAGGCAAMMWLIRTKPVPPMHTSFFQVPDVAVMAIEPHAARAPVVGYGSVRPKDQINIIPQVSGKLVFAHEDLAQGKIIPADELLFEIDPTVYEARVRQVEAEIRGLEAALRRHDQEMANLDARVANLAQMLTIDEKDYLTSKRLYDVDKVGTQRGVDLLYQKYLRQKDVLVSLKNQRAMVPHLQLETQAQLDAARARLKQSQHDLANTRIVCPFEARVESVGAHTSQVVTAHFSILTLTDMGAFEISVGIDPRELRWLAEAIRPGALERTGGGDGPAVKVSWSLPDQEFTWRGYVTRFERVDEATRTARMVVEVREIDMVAELRTGSGDVRPSLSIGMHCRAELPAEPLADAVLVPRHAIYEHRWVYVFERDPDASDGRTGRLGRREVPMLRSLGEYVLVDYADREGTEECELRPGDRLITSALTRPVVGMKVKLRDEQVVGAAIPTILPATPQDLSLAADPLQVVLAHLELIRNGS